ncbi:heavy metal translocating P-type ATPase [Psychromonas sp. 14N.309.X.WAT.B.A12]|uniref:heavy metal translocating P-type ATPase n=1 Tax=Psychromonas sp. 14N.309.X.WAT.B.A12 TaxID=2998322 RepID=UPI0025B264FF|nr:heavy metal translocating P-type ATPase [Psychromonas sp. 14N.309.X.WAT.B.A12]MDN2661952.1 heavy metal translocating P-type ATPase [Psychromonas sp. 14N.309.X.WAT.B.A12]
MTNPNNITFPVYGMHCASCATNLSKAFNQIEGIDSQVNLTLEKATLAFDKTDNKHPLAPMIMEVLSEKGYQTDHQNIQFEAEWSCSSCVESTLKAIKSHHLVFDATANFATKTLQVNTFAGVASKPFIKELIDLSPYPLTHKVAITTQQQLLNKQKLEQKKQRREHVSLAIAVLLSLPFWVAMINMLFSDTPLLLPWVEFALATPLQFIVGARFYKGAWSSLKGGSANMDVLVVLGTSAAYFFSLYHLLNNTPSHLYFETSSLVIVLIRLGKYLEFRAKQASSKAISALSQLQVLDALVKKGNNFKRVLMEEIQVNDIVQVAVGDKVPVDGIVIEGSSYIDESLLTGESAAIQKQQDDKVFAGTLNGDGTLLIKTTAVNEQTKLHNIIQLVESAQMSKAPILQLVDKVSAIFVPIVLVIAVITFVLWMFTTGDLEQALMHSVAVLVIACPCALGLATPTAMVVGTGLAAQKGILIKDINTLQLAHKLKHIAFDKTGTLTKGQVAIDDVTSFDSRFLPLLLAMQQSSKHPIAKAVVAYCKELNINAEQIGQPQNIHGEGLHGRFKEQDLLVGNRKLLTHFDIDVEQQLAIHTVNVEADQNVIYVCYAGTLLGLFIIADELRPESQTAITELKELDLTTTLISGDKYSVVQAMSAELGINSFYAEQTPEQKLQQLSLLQKDALVAMVGDGVNDAPALAQADVSIAMGGGSDVAKQTASMTLMHDDPRLIAVAMKISRATWSTIRQNLFWAFIFNALAIPAAALGYLSPSIAAIAMSASSLIVLSNSLLLKRTRLK